MEAFKRIGCECRRFEVFKRTEDDGSIIFKVRPDQVKDFKKIAAHVTNDQFHLAAELADPDGNATILDIFLKNRVATIGFNHSSYKDNQPAYKITCLRSSIS